MGSTSKRWPFVVLALGLAASSVNTGAEAASKPPTSPTTVTTQQRYPNVLQAKITATGQRRFQVSVTISSPYDTAERYADAWRVLDQRKRVLGERILLHDHTTEQPFTRTLEDIVIPKSTRVVEIQGRDKVYGWGGRTVKVKVP